MNMQTAPENHSSQQRQGRMIFLMMTFFFVLPILVVIAMYKLNWKPTGQSYGELISPPKLIQNTGQLKTSEGKSVPDLWIDKWSMVYVTAHCEQACLDRLHDMRQLHASLYKDMMRAQRVLITAEKDVSAIKSQYPDMVLINQPKNEIEQFSVQFNIGNEDSNTANRIYFVDPLGHVMISYASSIPAKNIRKDLVRLLKYSWAG